MAAQCPFPRHTKEQILAEIPEDEGKACQWGVDGAGPSPHPRRDVRQAPKIMDSILDNIGNTPLVRLNKIPQSEGIECEILAKCEFFNAGGSVKDRIGKRMVEDAEASGRLKKGDVLIEPTSGNTGIGLALAAALKGYRMIITLPEKMSQEKVDVLKALGAEIIRTPTEAAFDSPESHIGVAKRLNSEIPNSHILDQYSNPANPLAHYDGTAAELLAQCEGRIDAVVMTAGTGGTISGVARRIKEECPDCKVYGVDPVGSILALPNELNGPVASFVVEGIGYDFIPRVLDRSVIDQWIKTQDKEAFLMSRRLIKEEGLLCGGSSGSAMVAALKVAKTMKKGERLVVLLPDSTRNYMTKFLNDGWMVRMGYMDADEKDEGAGKTWWGSRTVNDLKLPQPHTVSHDLPCTQCIAFLHQKGYDQVPVLAEDGQSVLGVVTMGNLTSKILSGRVQGSDPVSKVCYGQYQIVDKSTTLATLSKFFDTEHFAIVLSRKRNRDGVEKPQVSGVATRIDLLNFVARALPASSP